MTFQITRRTFLKTAITAAAVAGPGQFIQPHNLLAAVPPRLPDGSFLYHPPMLSGIPLGGMGAGTVEIRADGRLHEWQIFNNWASSLMLPDTFFAIQTSGDGMKPTARRLETATDTHLVGTPVEQITYEGKFPFARLTYEDAELPVKTTLTAWSPFIPHNPRDSGMPSAIFTFDVYNPTSMPVRASVMASIRNHIGSQPGAGENIFEKVDGHGQITMRPSKFAHDASVTRPVRVLVLMEGGGDPSALRDTLAGIPGLTFVWPDVSAAGFKLSESSAEELKSRYDVVWIGEIGHARETLGDHGMSMIRDAVKLGMGLLLVGGWDSFYGNSKDRWAHLNNTPLEEALPVTFSDSFDAVGNSTRAHGAIDLPFTAPSVTEVQFGGYSKAKSIKPGAVVHLTADDGTPLLITGTFGPGRTAVWAPGAIGGWVTGDWDKQSFFRSAVSWLGGAEFIPGSGVRPTDSTFGTITLAALGHDASAATEWSDANHLWKLFAADGNISGESVPKDKNRNAALSQHIELAPSETKSVTFILTWHFPNHYDTSPKKILLGHQYSHWFKNSNEVMAETVRRHPEWYAKSMAFQESLYASSIDPKVTDAINAQLTTFNKETWWTADGTWAVWEGMGCCGLQTLDVGFYGSTPIALFFPEQEKIAMRLSARHQNDAGKMPHFFPGNFERPDAWDKIDLMPKFALMVYRDYLWNGDLNYLKEMWPVIKRAMAFDQRSDLNKDWLPDDHGADETYDGWEMEGTTSYVAGIWLAGLQASIRMAELLDDQTARADYAEWLERGQLSFDKQLWNGHYYQMSRSVANGHESTGVMLAGMTGQWFAHMCDLGYVFPEDKVKQHNLSALQYCRQATRPGMPYVNPSDGIAYVNGVWPDGKGPKGEGQWSGPWTGTEFMFASALASEGLTEQGLNVVTDVYDRYAKRLSPWSHNECGEHYYRALGVWAVLLSLQGFRWNAAEHSVGFTPRVQPQNHRSLFSTSEGWGDYYAKTENGQRTHRLHLKSGSLKLRELTVGLSPAEGNSPGTELRVTHNSKTVAATYRVNDGRLFLTLASLAELKAGDQLATYWNID